MTPLFVCLAALVPLLAFAYSDSSPVVAWTSQRSRTLDDFPSTVTKQFHFQSILEAILLSEDVCEHDAVILVDHPGLRASHLRRLDQNSPLVRRIATATSSIQLPYARSGDSGLPFDNIATVVSSRCGAQIVELQPEEALPNSRDDKFVVSISLNSVDSPAIFADFMDKVSSIFPNHLIVYSSDPPHFTRRQLEGTSGSSPWFSAPSDTMAGGGILKRYQLLTPGLILALLVVFFMLVPIIMLGVNVLASIQSPLRVEAPRSFNAKDKKNQ